MGRSGSIVNWNVVQRLLRILRVWEWRVWRSAPPNVDGVVHCSHCQEPNWICVRHREQRVELVSYPLLTVASVRRRAKRIADIERAAKAELN